MVSKAQVTEEKKGKLNYQYKNFYAANDIKKVKR